MKSLLVVRHAKSSWDEPDLTDFDRPLNDRGKRDAPRMGKRLLKRELSIDHICSSPAARAIATARLIASEIKFSARHIQQEQLLYHAGDDTILRVVRSMPDEARHVMIVGHNPGLTDFVNQFQGASIANVPTAGMVWIDLDIASWREADGSKGKFVFLDRPKD